MTRTRQVIQHLLYTLAIICIMACFFSVFMGLADLCGQALNDKEILMSEVWSAMTFTFCKSLTYGGPVILLESIYRLWGQIGSINNARN